jgi:SAM-dependent methyltransferase
MTKKTHWETIYTETDPTQVGWFQPLPEMSLNLVEASGVSNEGRIIDVGGGASVLVYYLLQRDFTDLTVLDLSAAALEKSKTQVGAQASRVNWIAEDITKVEFEKPFDLWHDRAVFHFLTDRDDRERYIRNLKAGLKPGGHLIMATFALDGPEKCSGLPVQRYDDDTLCGELGVDFALVQSGTETHVTPYGKEQKYIFCLFTRT